eukprot:CAMPEP_0194374590 /NCGR_PEP_ID=MMETSP0174-20130528/23029_1 /TAXON_ID=216777 /ORGANISM="Proboscia alata, Strain PI-D3" /LENGTH=655 /DNA_ID=CAMNT_0039154261 /DNA_START=67 /DNA_END=2034 /DNA_ORIENTATION=-
MYNSGNASAPRFVNDRGNNNFVFTGSQDDDHQRLGHCQRRPPPFNDSDTSAPRHRRNRSNRSQPSAMRNYDGSEMLDSNGDVIYRAQFLSSNPLRSDMKDRVGFGGKKMFYMSGDSVIRYMNLIFGHDAWSSEVLSERMVLSEQDDRGRWLIGYLAMVRVTIRHTSGENTSSFDSVEDSGFSYENPNSSMTTSYHQHHEDCGSGEGINPNKVLAHEKALKSAITDAMKRCIRHFGDRLGNAFYNKAVTVHNAPRDNVASLELLQKQDCKLFGNQTELWKSKKMKDVDLERTETKLSPLPSINGDATSTTPSAPQDVDRRDMDTTVRNNNSQHLQQRNTTTTTVLHHNVRTREIKDVENVLQEQQSSSNKRSRFVNEVQATDKTNSSCDGDTSGNKKLNERGAMDCVSTYEQQQSSTTPSNRYVGVNSNTAKNSNKNTRNYVHQRPPPQSLPPSRNDENNASFNNSSNITNNCEQNYAVTTTPSTHAQAKHYQSKHLDPSTNSHAVVTNVSPSPDRSTCPLGNTNSPFGGFVSASELSSLRQSVPNVADVMNQTKLTLATSPSKPSKAISNERIINNVGESGGNRSQQGRYGKHTISTHQRSQYARFCEPLSYSGNDQQNKRNSICANSSIDIPNNVSSVANVHKKVQKTNPYNKG